MKKLERIGEHLFVNADCVRGAVAHLPDASVDLIVTDPPYGIEGDRLHRHYNRDERFVVDGYVEVDAKKYKAFSRAWIAQAERVLRPGGQLYVVSGYTNLYDVLDGLRRTETARDQSPHLEVQLRRVHVIEIRVIALSHSVLREAGRTPDV